MARDREEINSGVSEMNINSRLQMVAEVALTRSVPTASLDIRISMSGKTNYSRDVELKIIRTTTTSGVVRHNEIFGG